MFRPKGGTEGAPNVQDRGGGPDPPHKIRTPPPRFCGDPGEGEACLPLHCERYFERRQVREAIAFAEGGGIAVHRNLDSYDGRLSPRGLVMRKPFVHVIGLRPQLEEWGRRHGLRPEWIQPEKRRRVAHYDVFGTFAQSLIDRLRP
jgi:hypothetical protein